MTWGLNLAGPSIHRVRSPGLALDEVVGLDPHGHAIGDHTRYYYATVLQEGGVIWDLFLHFRPSLMKH